MIGSCFWGMVVIKAADIDDRNQYAGAKAAIEFERSFLAVFEDDCSLRHAESGFRARRRASVRPDVFLLQAWSALP